MSKCCDLDDLTNKLFCQLRGNKSRLAELGILQCPRCPQGLVALDLEHFTEDGVQYQRIIWMCKGISQGTCSFPTDMPNNVYWTKRTEEQEQAGFVPLPQIHLLPSKHHHLYPTFFATKGAHKLCLLGQNKKRNKEADSSKPIETSSAMSSRSDTTSGRATRGSSAECVSSPALVVSNDEQVKASTLYEQEDEPIRCVIIDEDEPSLQGSTQPHIRTEDLPKRIRSMKAFDRLFGKGADLTDDDKPIMLDDVEIKEFVEKCETNLKKERERKTALIKSTLRGEPSNLRKGHPSPFEASMLNREGVFDPFDWRKPVKLTSGTSFDACVMNYNLLYNRDKCVTALGEELRSRGILKQDASLSIKQQRQMEKMLSSCNPDDEWARFSNGLDVDTLRRLVRQGIGAHEVLNRSSRVAGPSKQPESCEDGCALENQSVHNVVAQYTDLYVDELRTQDTAQSSSKNEAVYDDCSDWMDVDGAL